MRIVFDTVLDNDRVEEGEPIEPIDGAVAAVFQSEKRPTFHLMEDGSVTLVSKAGRVVPNFGTNGRVESS